MNHAISPQILLAIRDLKRLLGDAFGERLREVRLFGSMARGEATPDSDVDVLIVLDQIQCHAERIRASDAAFDAGFPHHLALSPLVLGADELERLRRWETALAKAIDRDGIPL